MRFTYYERFGTLLRAYALVGYSPDRDYRFLETNRVLRALHPEVVSSAIAQIERLGGSVVVDPATDLLTVNQEFSVSITVIRCSRTSAGGLRWKVRLDSSLKPDITIAVRMDAANSLAACIDPALAKNPLSPPLNMPVPKLSLANAPDRAGESSQPKLEEMIVPCATLVPRA